MIDGWPAHGPSELDYPGPAAVITRRGRWIHHVTITNGLTGLNMPWLAFGHAHAERLARRKLAWYKRKFGPPRERWTIPGAS